MPKLIALDFRPSERTLRQFGFVAFVAFGLLSVFAWREQAMFSAGVGALRQPLSYGLLLLALTSLTLGLVYPRANRPLYVGLSVIAYPIGQVVSYVLLAVLFYFVFGVVSVFLRVLGRDPMTRAYDRRAATYWNERRETPDVSSYLNQS